MRIDLHPEARTELRAAALWYEERRDQLGDELLVAVSTTLEKIVKAPESFPLWIGTEQTAVVIRKALVERFPYSVAFEQLESQIVVLAVTHQRRRPLYWLKRVAKVPG